MNFVTDGTHADGDWACSSAGGGQLDCSALMWKLKQPVWCLCVCAWQVRSKATIFQFSIYGKPDPAFVTASEAQQ